MSLVPIIYDLAREMDNYTANRSLFDDFGFGLYPHEIFQAPRLPRALFDPRLLQYPLERLNQQLAPLRDDKEKLNIGKDGFQVSVDVTQFKPNELTVKTADNYVVVEGKHEEREDDHGFVQRHFVRKYLLPNGYNPDAVVSTISSDGILTIKAPPPPKAIEGKERLVQIQETGTAHSAIDDKRKDTLAIKNRL